VLSPRQELLLRKVVEAYTETGLPVGSKTLATDPEIEAGPSTIRNELSMLEETGLLAHPHTSAGRVPTDAGHRWYVDQLRSGSLLPAVHKPLGLQLIRREVDEAMRVTRSSRRHRSTPRRSATSRSCCSSRRS
jgi:heat-inducible transcriptional repressor